MRGRLCIAFSGGRSSAVMTKMCYQKAIADGTPVVVIFANTGAEHPATLDFVRDVEAHWGIPIVWLEAVVHHGERIGTTHKVVTYETANRTGDPLLQASIKYGLPTALRPHCTERLKMNPIKSYLRSIGWEPNTYSTAVGIRADEMDRIRFPMLESGESVYPLVDAGITKEMVGAIMSAEPFDLQLPGDHYGNCVTCPKKSFRKLMTIARDDASWFDLFAKIEAECAKVSVGGKPPEFHPFYRKYKSVTDVLRDAREIQFTPYEDSRQMTLYDLGFGLDLDDLDESGSCGDSCEVFADAG